MELAEAFAPLPAGAGPIGLLSGDEFTPGVEAFDRALLGAAGGRRVALVVAAAGLAGAPAAARNGLTHYERLGATVTVVDVLSRDEASADRLAPFDVLFMCGGSPRALLRCLLGSPLWDEAVGRWRAGATLAGASAGAMALCEHAMVPGPGDRVPTRWTRGLGPVERVGLAVHATSRSGHWLEQVREAAPVPVVALDDETGVILRPGAAPRVVGPGRVWALAPAPE